MEKLYLKANDLLNDAFELGFRIIDSGFRPDLLLAVWRGGTPVAMAIQELLDYRGLGHHHFAIRTRHYRGIGERHDNVEVQGLEHALTACGAVHNILIVDDVHDTGLSIAAIIRSLEEHFHQYHPGQCPTIRVATPYFKPAQNRTTRRPDYFLYSTEQWIVFPHELLGLNEHEITVNKGLSPAVARRLAGETDTDGDQRRSTS